MDYLLGSLYVTRCYELLEVPTDHHHNNVSSLNPSAQDASLGVGAGMMETLSLPLEQSDLMESAGDEFTARRSTAKPSRLDRSVDGSTTTFVNEPGHHAASAEDALARATESMSATTNATNLRQDTGSAGGDGAVLPSYTSVGSGRTTPPAGAPFAFEIASPRSAESSPARSSLPPLRHAAPVEYSVPVCELENKYVLLYLAPPTEQHHSNMNGGTGDAAPYYRPPAHSLMDGNPPNTESAGSGGSPETSHHDLAQLPNARRNRPEGLPNPISAVALWKSQQQQQQQQQQQAQLQRSPCAVSNVVASPSNAKPIPLRGQNSPPLVAPTGTGSAHRPHGRASRSSPLALPTEKLLLLFYGLLMQQLREAERDSLCGPVDASAVVGPPMNSRRATLPESATPPRSPKPAASPSSALAAMGAIGAYVDAPVAVLALQYVPLAGGAADDNTLAADDAQLGVTTTRANAHGGSSALVNSHSAMPSSVFPSSSSAGATPSSGPSSMSTFSRAPSSSGSPVVGPVRHSAPLRTGSPLPANMLPPMGSAAATGSTRPLAPPAMTTAGTGITVTSTAGPPRRASVATTMSPPSSSASRLPNSAAVGAFSGPHSLLGHPNAATSSSHAPVSAKPLSEVTNLILDGSQTADLDPVYFDRSITDCSYYGGWYALRNGDAYRRVIDLFGLTSWPAVVLLGPTGKVVCYQALEHVENELGRYYYARYMKKHPKPSPPLLIPTSEDQTGTSGAAAASTAHLPSAQRRSSGTAGSSLVPPEPASSHAATTTHTDPYGTSFGGPKSPLSVEDQPPPSSFLSSNPSALHRCSTTVSHNETYLNDGPTTHADTVADEEDKNQDSTDQRTDLSATASPVKSGRTPHHEVKALSKAAATSTGLPRWAGIGSPAKKTAALASPIVTTSSPDHGATPSRATRANIAANETQVFSSPLEAGEPQRDVPQASDGSDSATHSHTDLGRSSSFTSGTLFQPGNTASLELTRPPRENLDVAVAVKDAQKTPTVVVTVPVGSSLPPAATSAGATAASEDHHVPSSSCLAGSCHTETSAVSSAADVSGPSHSAHATSRASSIVAVAGSTSATTAGRAAQVSFHSAFPWCPTTTTPATALSGAHRTALHFFTNVSESGGDDADKDEEKEAVRTTTTNSAVTAEPLPMRTPARPSLQPLLTRALTLAKSVADIVDGNLVPSDPLVTGVDDRDKGEESEKTAASASAADLPGAEAAFLIVVFGAHWHPAVARVLNAVAKLSKSLNVPARAGTSAKPDMDSEELDDVGPFSTALRGFAGGRGFFMGGGGTFSEGDGGMLNGGFTDSLEELEGGLTGPLTGADGTLNSTEADPRAPRDREGEDARSCDDAVEAYVDAQAAPRTRVLYVCTDDSVEALQTSVRDVPHDWRCLSPALFTSAEQRRGSGDESGLHIAAAATPNSEGAGSTSQSPLFAETPSRVTRFSPSSLTSGCNARYGDCTCRTHTHWSAMSATDVTAWLMGCFNVTALPRVVVLERCPHPHTGLTMASAGDPPPHVTWKPVQLYAESAHLFQDPTGAAFPWRDPNLLSTEGDDGCELNAHKALDEESSHSDGDEDEPCEDTFYSSLGRHSWVSPRSPACPFGSLGSSYQNLHERSVSGLMAWYSGAPLAATHSRGGGGGSVGIDRVGEEGEEAGDRRPPLLSTSRGRRQRGCTGTPSVGPHGEATDSGTSGGGVVGVLAGATTAGVAGDEAQCADDNDQLCLSDWARFVVPPIAPFTLEVTETVPPAKPDAEQTNTQDRRRDGTAKDGGEEEALGADAQSEDMYPTEPSTAPVLASAITHRISRTPAEEGAEVDTVQVPTELPLRLRRGGFFLVLCAFGPVEVSLHHDCLTALGEARSWLADVLSERKRKTWEAAQRWRDVLMLTIPMQPGQALTSADTDTQVSPRGSAGVSWMPAVGTTSSTRVATVLPPLASFVNSDDNNLRMSASPPPFVSVTSERSLNSTYVLNDVQRVLHQQAPAEYDGERGVASSGTTLPLVYFYDAVYPDPRLHASAAAVARTGGRAGGVTDASLFPAAGRNQTPEVHHDHTRAAREAHAADLAVLQEHIIANILEQDESQLPPREGEIFLACVRLPQKFTAVLRRRLPSESPATVATAAPSVSPALHIAPTVPLPSPQPSASSTATAAAATGAPPLNVPAPVTEVAPRPPSVATASASASASATRGTSRSNAAVSASTASGASARRPSLSLEGTEMGVDGAHSGSPSLAAALRQALLPDPDVHPVASAAMIKQFLYDHIVQGLQES